mmetsp:Transcript_14167/g.40461  ORF Transcript_14167/g.40461 Transcript_14167/m.40461 type:complete len:213 (+) Transcript_14167:241-879(+)
MVGQQLQRDNVDDRLNGAVQPRYPDDRILALDNVTDLLVVFVRHDYQSCRPRHKLLDDALHLVVHIYVLHCGDDDDRHELIDQGKWAVLHLPGVDTLAVHVGHLLDFQGRLNGSGIIAPTAKYKQRVFVLETFCELLDGIVEHQTLPCALGQVEHGVDNLVDSRPLADLVVGQNDGHHGDGYDLRRICLCAGNANLSASVDVDAAMAGTCNG